MQVIAISLRQQERVMAVAKLVPVRRAHFRGGRAENKCTKQQDEKVTTK